MGGSDGSTTASLPTSSAGALAGVRVSRSRRLVPVLLALLLALVAALLTAPSDARAATTPLPYRLKNVGDARQLIVVTSSSWGTSYATLTGWEKVNGRWRQHVPAISARIGYNGFVRAASRKQATGTTPAGTFRMPYVFGSLPNPGTKMYYRRMDSNDWWPYDWRDPKTYNIYQTSRVPAAKWRTGPRWSEYLWKYAKDGQYRHAVVIGFNLPTGVHWSGGQAVATRAANTSMGGGIFLHVKGKGATAGCVSVDVYWLRRIVQWLNPAAKPRIVMGPSSVITQM